MTDRIKAINITVEMSIKIMFSVSTVPFVMSVKRSVKFRNGTKEKSALDLISTIKAIMLGKKEMKVIGVRALCASLNVLDFEAMAMHRPLIKKEYAIMTTML